MTERKIAKKSGFKNYPGNDLFWVNEKGKYGCRYQCRKCGKVSLGITWGPGEKVMHWRDCPRMHELEQKELDAQDPKLLINILKDD